MKLKLLAGAAFALVAASPAFAVVIDFSNQTRGTKASPLVYAEAVFSSSTGLLFVGASAVANEICPLTKAFRCDATLAVVFTAPVNNLNFLSFSDNSASGLFVAITTTGGNFSFTGSSDGNFDSMDFQNLAAFSNITNISITNNDFNGLAYDRFTFEVANVPEPASWALMIAGFGLTGAAMRRRRAAVVA